MWVGTSCGSGVEERLGFRGLGAALRWFRMGWVRMWVVHAGFARTRALGLCGTMVRNPQICAGCQMHCDSTTDSLQELSGFGDLLDPRTSAFIRRRTHDLSERSALSRNLVIFLSHPITPADKPQISNHRTLRPAPHLPHPPSPYPNPHHHPPPPIPSSTHSPHAPSPSQTQISTYANPDTSAKKKSRAIHAFA